MGCSSSMPSPVDSAMSPSPWVRDDLVSSFHLKDFPKHWQVVNKLGQGNFAEVHALRYKKSRKSSRYAAIKISSSASDGHETLREARIWERIGQHENILILFCDVVIDGRIGLLMEKCEKSLSKHLLDMSSLGETSMTHMFRQMSLAIAHLESVQVAHRDVKPDNFLCKGDDPTLKLCDFGFSKLMPKSGQLFGTFGTPFFMSPEMVGDGPHNLKTDVWSLGASFYLMLYGECPYTVQPSTSKRVMRAIATGFPEPQYHGRDNVSAEEETALTLMLERSMSTRISATQLLQLPFLDLASRKKSTEKMVDKFTASSCTRAPFSDGEDSAAVSFGPAMHCMSL